MSRCILVYLRNRVSGRSIFIDGFHNVESLRLTYPLAAGQADPLLAHVPLGENLDFWAFEFKDMQGDGGEAVIGDPR
ncbi:hypothetical protein E6P97_01510 [Patescibacteria group bacterium]|nr:MAG: hypothetical protein E6P97_01510 [Patescibacteria group bacterium]